MCPVKNNLKDRFAAAYASAKAYGQEHLLAFYQDLPPQGQQALLTQLERLPYKELAALFALTKTPPEEPAVYKPLPATDKTLLTPGQQKIYIAQGEALLSAGAFAVVTLAGGQGTRLGHPGPKGTFNPGLPFQTSLFALQYAQIEQAEKRTGSVIPWYIMTSHENHRETISFFAQNNYFGAQPDTIIFFMQGMLPMLDFQGRVLLEEKGVLKEGADGHGGLFAALTTSGALADMRRRGVKWFYCGGIDNILARPADALFLGFAAASGAQAAGKTIYKKSPDEKVGVFCYKNNRPFVVEYSDISPEMAQARGENGELLYGDAHILCNLFRVDLPDKMAGARLPYHVAIKKASHIQPDGTKAEPAAPNAYKFESFLFDAFSLLQNLPLLRVKREEEFAPIKNKTGEDSPETALALYLAQKT